MSIIHLSKSFFSRKMALGASCTGFVLLLALGGQAAYSQEGAASLLDAQEMQAVLAEIEALETRLNQMKRTVIPASVSPQQTENTQPLGWSVLNTAKPTYAPPARP